MKRNFKPMAALAVCALGALAVSSCTKDEFFGLEDSVVIDASTKYEIAMSQEYADYARACFNIAESMKVEVDTTQMESFVNEDGKKIYYQGSSSQDNVIELLEILKKAFPEIEKADAIDFAEIQSIALTNNDALSDIAAKSSAVSTKGYNPSALEWLRSAYRCYYNLDYTPTIWSADMDGAYFSYYSNVSAAVNSAICATVDTNGYWYGGYIWNDYSSTLISSCNPYWPEVSEYGSPVPEADFLVYPVAGNTIEGSWELSFYGDFYWSHRTHYVYDLNGNSEVYYW